MKNTKRILMFLFIIGIGILPFSQSVYAQEKNNFSFLVHLGHSYEINYAKLYGYLFSSGRINASSTYVVVDELNPSKDTGRISAWFNLTPTRTTPGKNNITKLDPSIQYVTWKVYGGPQLTDLIDEKISEGISSISAVQFVVPSTGSFKIVATLKRVGTDGINNWDFEQETRPLYHTINPRAAFLCKVEKPSITINNPGNPTANPTFYFNLGSTCANRATFSIVKGYTNMHVYPYSQIELPVSSQNIIYTLNNTPLKAGNYKIFISVNSVNSKDLRPLNGSLEFIVLSNSLGNNENNGSNGYEINNYSDNGYYIQKPSYNSYNYGY